MSAQLDRANAHVHEAQKKVRTEYRPLIHAAPPVGWINDPNGLAFFQGEYQLYCQYHPYDTRWGPMHWGCWSSRNLARWTWRGVAMAPDAPYDADGCFSGTALEQDGRLLLMYTGVSGGAQRQCMAHTWGDGVPEKWPDNPVLDERHLPQSASTADFRDPKLMRVPGGYRALVAFKGREGGEVLSFFSKDLHAWRREGVFAGAIGEMAECPDFFELSGVPVLIACAMGVGLDTQPASGEQTALWMTGVLNAEGNRMEHGAMHPLDSGPDFYAPQTCLAPDGRRIMLGWMQSWKEESPSHRLGHGWCGQMSLPRELEMRDGRLLQHPVRELAHLRCNRQQLETTLHDGELREGTLARAAELDLMLIPEGVEMISLRVMLCGEEFVEILYDVRAETLCIDRSRCGYSLSPKSAPRPDVYSARVECKAGALRLRVFVDACSVEVFAGKGEAVLSTLAFPKRQGTGFRLSAQGGDVRVCASAWALEPDR